MASFPFFPCCLSLSHSHITFRGGFFFCLFPTKRCFGPISEDHFVHLATRFLRCWTLVSVAALVGLLLRQSSKQAPPQRRRSRTRRFTAVQKLLIVACIILLPGAAGGGNVGDGQRLSQRRVHRAKDGPRPGQRLANGARRHEPQSGAGKKRGHELDGKLTDHDGKPEGRDPPSTAEPTEDGTEASMMPSADFYQRCPSSAATSATSAASFEWSPVLLVPYSPGEYNSLRPAMEAFESPHKPLHDDPPSTKKPQYLSLADEVDAILNSPTFGQAFMSQEGTEICGVEVMPVIAPRPAPDLGNAPSSMPATTPRILPAVAPKLKPQPGISIAVPSWAPLLIAEDGTVNASFTVHLTAEPLSQVWIEFGSKFGQGAFVCRPSAQTSFQLNSQPRYHPFPFAIFSWKLTACPSYSHSVS